MPVLRGCRVGVLGGGFNEASVAASGAGEGRSGGGEVETVNEHGSWYPLLPVVHSDLICGLAVDRPFLYSTERLGYLLPKGIRIAAVAA